MTRRRFLLALVALASLVPIYSPLDEGAFTAGSIIANRAQSLTALKVGSDRVMRGTD